MKLLPVIAAAAALAVSLGARAAPDADAAMAQMKESGCTKCHAADKTKKGPSFKKTAEKYQGKADAYGMSMPRGLPTSSTPKSKRSSRI